MIMNLQLKVVASKECLQPISILRLTILASCWMIREQWTDCSIQWDRKNTNLKTWFFTSQFFGLNKGLISPFLISHIKSQHRLEIYCHLATSFAAKQRSCFSTLLWQCFQHGAQNFRRQESLTFYFRSNKFIAQIINLQLCWY